MDEPVGTCRRAVLALFPDICPDYLDSAMAENEYDHETLIMDILDQTERGNPYPRRQRPNLKRKRRSSQGKAAEAEAEAEARAKAESEAEMERRKFDNPERRQAHKSGTYIKASRSLLMQAYPLVFAKEVTQIMEGNNNCLFPTFFALHDRVSGKLDGVELRLKQQRTKENPLWREDQIEATIQNTTDQEQKRALEEFHAARLALRNRQARLDAEKQREREEQENMDHAIAEGTIAECECCFEERALNRMVHCDGDVLHWFCWPCAKQMAETQIGLSKYQLSCMSMDGCKAGFSRGQRDLFLGPKLVIALDRIEQEAVLRMAGIENLETCPFCPFAAECLPVEENKEFICQNPGCEVVSCRMCRRETHIPKTCEDAARESGLSARRLIEEAMSAALIRNCNKCMYTHPFAF